MSPTLYLLSYTAINYLLGYLRFKERTISCDGYGCFDVTCGFRVYRYGLDSGLARVDRAAGDVIIRE